MPLSCPCFPSILKPCISGWRDLFAPGVHNSVWMQTQKEFLWVFLVNPKDRFQCLHFKVLRWPASIMAICPFCVPCQTDLQSFTQWCTWRFRKQEDGEWKKRGDNMRYLRAVPWPSLIASHSGSTGHLRMRIRRLRSPTQSARTCHPTGSSAPETTSRAGCDLSAVKLFESSSRDSDPFQHLLDRQVNQWNLSKMMVATKVGTQTRQALVLEMHFGSY